MVPTQLTQTPAQVRPDLDQLGEMMADLTLGGRVQLVLVGPGLVPPASGGNGRVRLRFECFGLHFMSSAAASSDPDALGAFAEQSCGVRRRAERCEKIVDAILRQRPVDRGGEGAHLLEPAGECQAVGGDRLDVHTRIGTGGHLDRPVRGILELAAALAFQGRARDGPCRKFGMGTGDAHDRDAAPLLAAGSFARIPARMPHYAWTDHETVVQINGGPFDITYVSPKDDPRAN
jgi:hypothetical protein